MGKADIRLQDFARAANYGYVESRLRVVQAIRGKEPFGLALPDGTGMEYRWNGARREWECWEYKTASGIKAYSKPSRMPHRLLLLTAEAMTFAS